ncbi:MAG: type II CRISPR RNA-guided endonuclease Cas9, partial [Erysipelotrichaceae bacterium]|nr:type II CRISPR RNA-guided endonuclease Cas9 [Erysipelotrichaceae bacterium]
CKAVNDCIVLKEVLSGNEYISFAKVDVYKQHQEDLAFLKRFMRKYLPKKYDDMFRNDIEGNYVAYSGNTKSLEGRKSSKKSANSEAFLNYVKATVKAVTPEEEDQSAYDDMMKRIELGTFMPKQVNSNNRVIPHQVYWNELNAILQNAKEYLPFLQEKDDAGYSNIKKILSTFEFRVPYYVGPLNNGSEKAWVVRTKEPILPWTFKDVVDEDESEKQFIDRLINQCTYLPGENVLPKTSMVYQKFEVLNEINNIKVNGRSIPVLAKQGLFNDLFMNKKKVTVKNIKEYLKCNGYYTEEELETLSGLDITVKSSMSMAISFSALLNNGIVTFEQAEDIILHSTYSEDKTRLKTWIEKTYPSIAAEDVSYLCKLKCKDFGRLSGKFLLNFSGMNNETGEVKTILNWMWDENYNLMQLLSNEFDFVENIEEARKEYYSGKQRKLNDVLDDLYVPNGAKRPIYRTLDIIRDVVKANGGEHPKKIFVEMARGANEDQKNKRTKSRYQQLLDLYKEVRDTDVRDLKKSLEEMGDSVDNKLQSDRLFLYYMQLGKCMYTGNPIEISMLYDGTVNIEHIYPQAKVKDDSILNNEVLVMSKENGQKSDTYPVAAEIRSSMRGYWKYLKDHKLITEEKYNRLTRSTPFTQEEQWGFINRQLVETRQSTKAIASILKEKYPNSEIVYVKAGLVSDFRHEFDMLKSRVVNDLHHAKDAYLNIVVGNVYNSIFTKNWFMANYDSNYSIKTTTLFGKVRTVGDAVVWNG